MNAELEKLWKQPFLANFIEGARLHYGEHAPWLHSQFVHALFYTSDALPMKASAKTLALETARHVVGFLRPIVEREFAARGFVTGWTDEQCEEIAREMANKFPRHPGIAKAVLARLENERHNVFVDRSLTHGDELFFVRQMHRSDFPQECHEEMTELGIEVIKEDFIATIDRSLDYINELRSIKASRPFIPLLRILTSLHRVHDVVPAT